MIKIKNGNYNLSFKEKWEKNQKKIRRKNVMAVITMKQLLEVGAHFGHQAKRWNPKMKPYIFTERNGIHILDLRKKKYVDNLQEYFFSYIRNPIFYRHFYKFYKMCNSLYS